MNPWNDGTKGRILYCLTLCLSFCLFISLPKAVQAQCWSKVLLHRRPPHIADEVQRRAPFSHYLNEQDLSADQLKSDDISGRQPSQSSAALSSGGKAGPTEPPSRI